MIDLDTILERAVDPLRILGIAGQLVFAARFVWQWIVSERRGESVIPLGFWWCSIVGGTMTLAYGLLVMEPPVILGQLFNNIVYTRNLVLIRRKNRERAAEEALAAARDGESEPSARHLSALDQTPNEEHVRPSHEP